jgi:hypothetical protein
MMHVSWTTLREQIFAKLRRPYRSEANMNEVGHVKMLNIRLYYMLYAISLSKTVRLYFYDTMAGT